MFEGQPQKKTTPTKTEVRSLHYLGHFTVSFVVFCCVLILVLGFFFNRAENHLANAEIIIFLLQRMNNSELKEAFLFRVKLK